MSRFSLLFLLAMLFSCQKTDLSTGPETSEAEVIEYELGSEVDLKFGESIVLSGLDITIQFSGVPEDSRCPIGVTCVWAGNGKVKLLFNDEEIFLNTNLDPQFVNINGFRVDLVLLTPYPVYEETIENEDYTVRLQITKN